MHQQSGNTITRAKSHSSELIESAFYLFNQDQEEEVESAVSNVDADDGGE
jgi:hypothetical protein